MTDVIKPDEPGVINPDDPGAVVSESHEAFVVEQRGIDYIPGDQRDGKPIQLAWMWAGGLLNVLPVVFGGLLPLIGLSFWQSVLAVIVGNVTWIMVGFASQSGPDAGTTVMMIARAPFGRNGQRPVGLFSWLMLLGFEASFMIIIVEAGVALFERAGLLPGDVGKTFIILAAGVLIPIVALYGHATVVKVLGWACIPFGIVFVILAIWVLPKTHVSSLHHNASLALWFVGLSIAAAASGIGFVTQAADFSRYLPRNTNRPQLFWATTLGGFIPEVLLTLLGVAIGTRLTEGVDAVSGVPTLVAGWFAVIYLLMAIFQLMAANAFALYSSGVTLQSIGLKLKRWQCVFLDTCICVAVTFVAIFSHRFNTLLADFLLFSLVFEAPFATIYLTDWVLRRGYYKSRDLEVPRGGIYWRNGGLHWPGLIALAVGMVAVLMWIDTTVYVGPLSSRTGGSDLSWILGIVVACGLYLLLAWKGVRREAEEAKAARIASEGISDHATRVGAPSPTPAAVPGVASAATPASGGPTLSET
jgi:purine-cytosine permease-like protein